MTYLDKSMTFVLYIVLFKKYKNIWNIDIYLFDFSINQWINEQINELIMN